MSTLPRFLDATHRLDEEIGNGGMGVVYRGENVTLGKPVAIKLLLPEARRIDGLHERFRREARAAACIDSSHVVDVFHFGQTDEGELYLVMEMLEGQTIEHVLGTEGPLHPARVVSIGLQLCSALGAAHDKNIVHRDLKAANIMLIERDGSHDFVKVLDFGIAKLIAEQTAGLTGTGAVLGTFSSVAPEQVTGKPLDGRTDVYALGVLFYRMLSGRAPFVGNDPASLAYQHVHEAPPPLDVPGVSPALTAIAMRCLAKAPTDRFQNMADLAIALSEAGGLAFAPQTSSDSTTTHFATPTTGMHHVMPKEQPESEDPAIPMTLMLDRTMPLRGPEGLPVARVARPWLERPPALLAAGLMLGAIILLGMQAGFRYGKAAGGHDRQPAAAAAVSNETVAQTPVEVPVSNGTEMAKKERKEPRPVRKERTAKKREATPRAEKPRVRRLKRRAAQAAKKRREKAPDEDDDDFTRVYTGEQ